MQKRHWGKGMGPISAWTKAKQGWRLWVAAHFKNIFYVSLYWFLYFHFMLNCWTYSEHHFGMKVKVKVSPCPDGECFFHCFLSMHFTYWVSCLSHWSSPELLLCDQKLISKQFIISLSFRSPYQWTEMLLYVFPLWNCHKRQWLFLIAYLNVMCSFSVSTWAIIAYLTGVDAESSFLSIQNIVVKKNP